MKDSPLSEVVRDRRFNEILASIRKAVELGGAVTIGPKEIHYIRETFYQSIQLGERRLHRLAQIFLQELTSPAEIKTTFVVWGRCPKPGHSEILKGLVSIAMPDRELYNSPDSQFSNQHAPLCRRCGLKTNGISSFIAYAPDPIPRSGLLLLTTRIKTTSNLCYKVADMVFDIDRMFQRDKIRGRFSQMVTDVYGIKVIVKAEKEIWNVLDHLRNISGLTIEEEKDYVGPRKKKSGFEVYKGIAKGRQQLFESQMQDQKMLEMEESSLPASHRTYKERQMADRRKLGKEYVDLYKALTALFAPPDQKFVEIGYIELGFTKKGLDDEF